MKCDAILIDNDLLVCRTWKKSSEKAGVTLHTFISPSEFYLIQDQYSRQTPIYVDSHLNDKFLGEVEAKKLFELGFTEIYLETGYPLDSFPPLPWIRAIIGKDPPWSY